MSSKISSLGTTDDCPHYQARLDFADEIEVMRQKENTTYKCGDYISRRKLQDTHFSADLISTTESEDFQHVNDVRTMRDDEEDDEGNDEENDEEKEDIIVSCRLVMCEWCYRVVDHFGARRELVEIAMNYVDRLSDKFNW